MYRDRFTKIVATLGPASSSRERLRTLYEAGADVFRLNFSHGTQDDHRQRVDDAGPSVATILVKRSRCILGVYFFGDDTLKSPACS